MEMLEHRGILDRFTTNKPVPPFLNFGMFALDLRTLDFPHPYGLVIGQARVEALLEERAKALGVEIRRGHEVLGFKQALEEVRVEVRTASGNYELSGRFLTGCDGGHVTALRELFSQLLKNDQTYRFIAEMITSVEIRYDVTFGIDKHPLTGRWAPNLTLITDKAKTKVADLMHRGKGLFIDVGGRAGLHEVAANWADRVDTVQATCYARPAKVDAFIIRPDGYIADVVTSDETDQESQKTMHAALAKWFGVADARSSDIRSA